jgi:fido (protein-threonine AMPylation protein)
VDATAAEIRPRLKQIMDGAKQKLDEAADEQSPVEAISATGLALGQVHPFSDGNRRFARFMIGLMLVQRGVVLFAFDDADAFNKALICCGRQKTTQPFIAHCLKKWQASTIAC